MPHSADSSGGTTSNEYPASANSSRRRGDRLARINSGFDSFIGNADRD
jgi:hypothetical protein